MTEGTELPLYLPDPRPSPEYSCIQREQERFSPQHECSDAPRGKAWRNPWNPTCVNRLDRVSQIWDIVTVETSALSSRGESGHSVVPPRGEAGGR